jgi:hypothetical protein
MIFPFYFELFLPNFKSHPPLDLPLERGEDAFLPLLQGEGKVRMVLD